MAKTIVGMIAACCVFAGCGDQGHTLVPAAKQIDALVNAHDVDGFINLLTDDVVVMGPEGSMHSGKDAVRAWITGYMPGFHADSRGWEQSGDTLRWMSTVRSDAFAKMGINPMKLNATAVFSGGKLKYFSPVPDVETSHKMLFLQFYTDVVNGGNIEAIDKYVAQDIVEHQPLPPNVPKGRDGVKAFFKMIHEAFPDLHGTPSVVLADGDYVFVSGTWEGTNKGKFMGKPPSNKKLTWTVADVIRLANGQAVDHWGWDEMAERMAASRGK